jgi:hypothetical protein|tara:strand:+ start:537 stop:728 length:192 start_codon:yes stop_codon:yes gene_type:complete
MIREPDTTRERTTATRQYIDAEKVLVRIELAEEMINAKMCQLIEERRKLLNEKGIVVNILSRR